MNLKSIGKALHDVAYESRDDQPEPEPASRPATYSHVNTAQPPTPITALADSADVSEIYNALKSASDPDLSQPLKKINELARPLEGIIPDRGLRLRAAMAQSGIIPQVAAAGVDVLLKALDGEQKKFALGRAGCAHDAEDDEAQARNVEQQINELQSKLKGLRASAESTRREIAQKESAFAGAYERRKAELMQMKSEFASSK